MNSVRLNLTISTVVCFLLFLLSCTTQETAPVRLSENGVNLDLVKEVAAITNQQVQKAAFTDMLNSQEKLYIMKSHVIEKQEELSLNKAQQDHLNFLLASVPDDLYSNKAKKAERQAFLAKWTVKARTLFESEQLADIVSSLSSKKNQKAQEYGLECNCNYSQDYCGRRMQCVRLGSCSSEFGCGAFIFFSCNGTCDPVMPSGF